VRAEAPRERRAREAARESSGAREASSGRGSGEGEKESGWAAPRPQADLGVYDYAALVPVLLGAGGVMTGWRGEPLTMRSLGEARQRAWHVRHLPWTCHPQAQPRRDARARPRGVQRGAISSQLPLHPSLSLHLFPIPLSPFSPPPSPTPSLPRPRLASLRRCTRRRWHSSPRQRAARPAASSSRTCSASPPTSLRSTAVPPTSTCCSTSTRG